MKIVWGKKAREYKREDRGKRKESCEDTRQDKQIKDTKDKRREESMSDGMG